jgi:hypothetical protein
MGIRSWWGSGRGMELANETPIPYGTHLTESALDRHDHLQIRRARKRDPSAAAHCNTMIPQIGARFNGQLGQLAQHSRPQAVHQRARDALLVALHHPQRAAALGPDPAPKSSMTCRSSASVRNGS